MAQNTNLNIAPYFDDFDKSKGFLKVLFKPGFPVQARELTTLQTLLQDQIDTFGQGVYKEGSMVVPGGITLNKDVSCILIQNSYLNLDVENYRTMSQDFGLPENWDKRHLIVDSSGGEKKKNELIQMLQLAPKCAILDEPDSGLDVDGIKRLTQELNNYNPDNILIIITHYQQLIEQLNVDSVSILKDQKIKQYEGKDKAYEIFEQGFDNV